MAFVTRRGVLATSLLVGLAVEAVPMCAMAQTSALVMHSQPGDWVGQGMDQTFTTADGVFTPSINRRNGVSVNFNGGPHWWYLDFAAPGNAPLAVGVYEGATRFPFHSPTKPGMDIAGEGRGCNELTGRFNVLEVEYGPGTVVQRFAATFEQHCEGGVPALTGSIQVNSTLPPPPPPPVHCVSEVATIQGLLNEVARLPTSTATLATLGYTLLVTDWLVANHYPAFARTTLAQFTTRTVAASNLAEGDPSRIGVSAANSLACGASNVLLNISVP
jgi:hypothetical protein